MWQKIKNIFSVVGAVLSIALFTFILFLLRRGDSDRRGSSGDAERDHRIQEGFTRATDTVGRCEERLQRAEDILRGAIERSKQKE